MKEKTRQQVLQIDREYFVKIAKGEHKIEHRLIYSSNETRYLDEDENGEIVPREYDTLKLINGRRKNAPTLVVEVEKAEIYYVQDEDGNDVTYVDKSGDTCYLFEIWYYLGKVLSIENAEGIL